MRWAEPLLKTSTQRQLPSPKHQAHPLYPLSQANLLHPFHTHVRYTLHITHYFLLPIPHTAHSVQQAAYSTRHTAYRTQQINIHAYVLPPTTTRPPHASPLVQRPCHLHQKGPPHRLHPGHRAHHPRPPLPPQMQLPKRTPQGLADRSSLPRSFEQAPQSTLASPNSRLDSRLPPCCLCVKNKASERSSEAHRCHRNARRQLGIGGVERENQQYNLV